jgi:NAD(P)-dependent dehydrogenase (short-subunit alcohol dehydrogenase family)
MRFDGKAVLITGGAQGIGLACATRFANEGARVGVVDLNRAVGEPAAAAIGALFIEADVARKSAVDDAVQAFIDHAGRIDILVNNAGITHAAEFLDVTEEAFDRVLAVNLKSYYLTGQAVAKHMVATPTDDGSERGSIVNLSSVNAVLAIPNQVPYVVSKGGVQQLTKVMALALAPHGIRVNAIGPGTIATELAMKAVMGDQAARDRVMGRTPLKRLGTPEEVASIAAFLASADASYMTGQTLFPDGGRLALNYTVAVDP